MVQGGLKKASKTSKVTKNVPKRMAPKKIAPKKATAVRQAVMTKKHSKALTAATEKLIASRVGHLELVKGTRKELEKKKEKK